ncbi:MAG: hypothetical protein MZW92_47050 [Comamonadaceae bacterium]|nr:hypothetical protein [Comamonadaceae bacterium]
MRIHRRGSAQERGDGRIGARYPLAAQVGALTVIGAGAVTTGAVFPTAMVTVATSFDSRPARSTAR